MSLLEAHLGIPSHVLIHFGTTSGQGAGTGGVSGVAGLVLIGPALEGLGITLDDGHTVVEAVYVEVTVEWEGQSVTVGAQLVTVISIVVQIVDNLGVTVCTSVVMAGWVQTVGELALGVYSTVDGWISRVVELRIGIECGGSEEISGGGGRWPGGFSPGVQSKSIWWIFKSHSPNLLSSGRVNSTETAPPHCWLTKSTPSGVLEAIW